MTIGELLGFVEARPYIVLFFFIAIPLAAYLSNVLGKGEGHLNPWCSFYSVLIYLSVIPGIFSILLNLYHLLFESTSIYDVNLMLRVVPILSMFLSLYLIKQNVSFDNIPGFDRITGFTGMVGGIMVLFFFLDKTRMVAFTYIPILWIVFLLIIIYLLIRYGTKYLIK